MNIGAFLDFMIFASAILLILLILLQQRGASLGAGLSGSGEFLLGVRVCSPFFKDPDCFHSTENRRFP